MNLVHIPIFPLNTVLFPGGLLPLRIFEARYMDMTRECLKTGKAFGVCLIREGREVGEPATPEPVGCLARIIDWDMQQLGLLHITVQGEQRFRIHETRTSTQGLVSADVELIPAEGAAAVPKEYAACVALLRSIAADAPQPIFAEPHRFDDAVWVGYRLSEVLPVPLAAKQQLLELNDSLTRLSALQRFLQSSTVAKD